MAAGVQVQDPSPHEGISTLAFMAHPPPTLPLYPTRPPLLPHKERRKGAEGG
jgi:hypothetical protein